MSISKRPLVQKFTEAERQRIQAAIQGRTTKDPQVITFGDSEVSTQANTASQLSEFIDIQVPAGMYYVFPANIPVAIFTATHEEFRTSGSASDLSVGLSNDLVDSPVVGQTTAGSGNVRQAATIGGQQDLVLFATTGATTGSSEQVDPTLVDYTNNSFTFDQSASDNDYLEAYYLWGDPSQIVGRAYDQTLERYEMMFATTARTMHLANVYDDESKVTFRNNFALNEKEHLKFFINTAVDLTNWDATGTSGPKGSQAFPYFEIPAYKFSKSR